MKERCPRPNTNDLQIAVEGRLRVRVFRTEHVLLVWRPKIFEVRVLRTLIKLELVVFLVLQSEGRYCRNFMHPEIR